MRSNLLCLATAVASLAIAGCLPEPPPDAGTLTGVEARGPATAEQGQTVALTAQVSGGAAPENLSYRWFQTFGRAVEINGADSAAASFEAPSVPVEQALSFRVDVTAADGTTHSATVEVRVAADPDYGLDKSVGEDGSAEKDPHPRVRLVTSKGTIVVELDRVNAPLTVNNFLRYVDESFYESTIFHRVIAEFMIQGGGFEPGLVEKDTRSPIRNESDNGLKNDRGTIAMARTTALDSATSQFFINVVDNNHLNATKGANGYAVFGRVIQGMNIVDEIAEVETEARTDPDGKTFNDVPVEDVILRSVDRYPGSTIPR